MRTVPNHIERALTLAGGKRLNGEPMYKFVWSSEFTYLLSNGKGYEPFRVVADDCWLLVKYELPDFWGTQAEWEMENWEMGATRTENGLTVIEPLYTAGPYPKQGRYRNIMRIKRVVKTADGETYMENCAPTLQWVEEFFPGVRDFLNLTTEEKAAHLIAKEKAEKEQLNAQMSASRQLYKGSGTAKQIQAKEEAIERWLQDEKAVAEAQKLLASGKTIHHA